MPIRIIEAGSMLALALTAAACDADSPDLDDPLEALSYRTGGGMWIGNGLEDPDVSGIDPAHGLSTREGLHPTRGLLATPSGIEVATYLVECALPEGESIVKVQKAGDILELTGALGLAPEWKDGACDETCQEWVSACLLARTNVTGETVGLWLSADHPALGLGHDPGYPLYEATFYGNVFQDPDALYLCHGTQATGLLSDYLEGRTCGGQPVEACGFTDWGACHGLDRCLFDNGHATECAEGDDPATGIRHRSISTFVSAPGWAQEE
jgi:hypothetical protein